MFPLCQGLLAHFFLMLSNIPLSGCGTVYLSMHLLEDVLGTFRVLAVMNKAAANTHVPVLCAHGFLLWVSTREHSCKIVC